MSDLKTRITVFGVSIFLAVLFLLPTFFKDSFKDMQWISKPLSLGLDLAGGVHLVYEVQQEEAVRSRMQSIATAVRSEMREAKIALTTVKVPDTRRVEFTFLNDQTAERGKSKIQELHKDLILKDTMPDGSKVKLAYTVTDQYADRVGTDAVSQAVETLRNRVDQFGVSEPIIQRSGTNRIILQMPGVSDVASVKKVVGNVAKLEFRLLPKPGGTESTSTIKDKSGATVPVEDQVLMSGQDVSVARVSFDQGVSVALTFNAEGARTFRKITTENVNRQLAIILDNVLYSAPNINEPIGGGTASISGGFTVEEAKQLAVVLRAGALPAPLKVMEERTVGPSLGAESIRKGVFAIAAGFIAIALFMIAWYKKSGIVAVVSLALNLFFILAILSAFGATMTLPGLAALALTVGVAVDSNVIIFERIKDELYAGQSRDTSIRLGFDKAYSAIFDSNICALFTGIILYILGTGPVRGFAVTLSIGVCTTMFCAVYVAKIAFNYFTLKGNKFSLSI